MNILSTGNYCEAAAEASLPDLKALVKAEAGQHIRRVSRFVQLALIGASRCVRGVALPPRTGIYLTSCHGDVGVAAKTLAGLYRDGNGVSPLDFINSVSNAGCFYVAKMLNLAERTNFVTSRYASMNAALQIARLDLQAGEIDRALVGSIECCAEPLAHHRRRLGVAADCVLGEASHWLLLGPQAAEKSLGRIRYLRSFQEEHSLRHWCESLNLPDDVLWASGRGLQPAAMDDIRQRVGVGQVFEYAAEIPFYDAKVGQGIWEFLHRQGASMLVHVDRDPAGKYYALGVERA